MAELNSVVGTYNKGCQSFFSESSDNEASLILVAFGIFGKIR